MDVIKGSLTDVDLLKEHGIDVIAHGANNRSVMGAGVALQIRKVFPEAYESDQKFPYPPEERLGKFSWVRVVRDEHIIFILNLYQQDLDGSGLQLDKLVEALELFVWHTKTMKADMKLALPYNIGCGLASGDWDVVRPAIEKVLEGVNAVWIDFNG